MAKTVKTPDQIEAAKQAANEKRRAKAAEKRAAEKAAKEVAPLTDPPAPPTGSADQEPPAGDPKGADPTPEFRGLSASEMPEPPKPPVITKGQGEADPFRALALEYAKAYPDNPVFHITSDRQVFLEGDLNLARLHQAGQDPLEQVKSIKF